MVRQSPLLLLMLFLLGFSGQAAASCTAAGEKCVSQTNGVCSQEHLTYNCTTTTQSCSTYSTTTTGACGANTADTQNQTATAPTNSAFNNAMKDLALLNAIKKDLTGINPIRIFGGKYYNCVNPLASGIGLTVNCCNSQLKPNAKGIFAGCAKTAVKLAGYVRAGTAYQFAPAACNGGFALFGACIVCSGSQQDYCVFNNLLAQIIQIKGRQQLAALAAAGYGGAKSGPAQNFSYTNGGLTQANGNWVAFPTVNNNLLWAWQWPGECNSASAGAALQCPSQPQLMVAYCNQSNCTAPSGTQSPLSATPAGDQIVSVNPASDTSQAISKYAVLTGSCSTSGACSYIESAYRGTAGGGAGDAVLTAKLTFPLTVYATGTSNGYLTSSATANAEFWGQSLPMATQGQALPTTVNIKYTQGNVEQGGLNPGNAQNTVALSTHILMTSNTTIPGNTLGAITVFGGCSQTSNLCTYTFEVPANVTAKPWYTGTNSGPCRKTPVQSTINCSGFTLQQFEELNLGKMHLGSILLQMVPKVPSQTTLQTSATGNASAQGAQGSPSSPMSPVAGATSS